ncbi:hypothetical protein [Metabacillus fastidiosus]|uniref:DUF2178 domain-containing protein n=1 Tax=Metabacillus fastidiosus TaxID=1458 RepID=A0ABU6NUU1_9BACI|nr:hypothetical protein [Metabacillus fastidiosus]MED4400911.1 hypothetical protein [Metabacillus fastidiosus]MED4463837.1 hypothetical protein [Metabacillus fastidiosus]
MKKTVLQPALLNFVLVALAGWVLSSLYMYYIQLAEVIKNPEPSWEITISIYPFFFFLLIGIPIAIYLTKKNKKKHRGLRKVLMMPSEFEESDERERYITAKACRSSYITMMFIGPLAAGLMTFYPLVQEKLPYYPIIVIMLIPLAQIAAYFISFNKNI